MMIIPVLDLMAGQVVRAERGQRSGYRPLSTPLADSSDPSAVLRGLASLYSFSKVYVADLDAIEGHGDQHHILQTLAAGFPACEFWIDAGPRSVDLATINPDRLRPVLGSESHGVADLDTALGKRPDAVLSIDFRAETLLGDERLLQADQSWPGDVIIMNLDRVGSREGPDLDCIARLMTRPSGHSPTRYYAAGGIRHDADLHALARLNIHGALIATALHQGRIHICRHDRNTEPSAPTRD